MATVNVNIETKLSADPTNTLEKKLDGLFATPASAENVFDTNNILGNPAPANTPLQTLLDAISQGFLSVSVNGGAATPLNYGDVIDFTSDTTLTITTA